MAVTGFWRNCRKKTAPLGRFLVSRRGPAAAGSGVIWSSDGNRHHERARLRGGTHNQALQLWGRTRVFKLRSASRDPPPGTLAALHNRRGRISLPLPSPTPRRLRPGETCHCHRQSSGLRRRPHDGRDPRGLARSNGLGLAIVGFRRMFRPGAGAIPGGPTCRTPAGHVIGINTMGRGAALALCHSE